MWLLGWFEVKQNLFDIMYFLFHPSFEDVVFFLVFIYFTNTLDNRQMCNATELDLFFH
jgi:hypothetical protein